MSPSGHHPPSPASRGLTAVFIALFIVLTVILTINLKRQKEILDRQVTPMRAAWESIVEKGYLEKTLGLTFVRSSKIFQRRTDLYLYPRRYTSDELGVKVEGVLTQHGVRVANIRADPFSGDVTFRLGPEGSGFGELICTPDMSTYAGEIALIIDDFGYNLNDVVKSFLNFSVPLTYAVLPGHAHSREVATLAHEAGFEVIVHMPMDSREDLPEEEEFVLKRDLSTGEIRQRQRNALLEVPYNRGVNNHQGSDATESRRIMRAVAAVLRSEGKYFIDSRTTPNSVAVEEMERAGVPVGIRNVFIDYEDRAETIERQMELLARTAREKGMAVGVGHPRKNTLEVLRKQIPLLQGQGFKFVFSSVVVR